MTFEMEYTRPNHNGGYNLRFTDSTNTQINLDVHGWSFGKALTDIFKDFPNDFRDEVHKCMVDYALAYFQTNPIPEDEQERFFDLIGEITEHDYEEGD